MQRREFTTRLAALGAAVAGGTGEAAAAVFNRRAAEGGPTACPPLPLPPAPPPPVVPGVQPINGVPPPRLGDIEIEIAAEEPCDCQFEFAYSIPADPVSAVYEALYRPIQATVLEVGWRNVDNAMLADMLGRPVFSVDGPGLPGEDWVTWATMELRGLSLRDNYGGELSRDFTIIAGGGPACDGDSQLIRFLAEVLGDAVRSRAGAQAVPQPQSYFIHRRAYGADTVAIAILGIPYDTHQVLNKLMDAMPEGRTLALTGPKPVRVH